MALIQRPSGLVVPEPKPEPPPPREYHVDDFSDHGEMLNLLRFIERDGATLVSVGRGYSPGRGILLEREGFIVIYWHHRRLEVERKC